MSYISHDRPLRFCAGGDSRTQNAVGFGQWADSIARSSGWKRVGIADAALAQSLLTNIDATVNNMTDNWRRRLANYHADIYAIFVGVNDSIHTGPAATLLTRATWGAQVKALLENLITLPWGPTVYFLGMIPMYGVFAYPFGTDWTDCWAQMDDESHLQCNATGATFVPLCSYGNVGATTFYPTLMPATMFMPEGVHPNPAGMVFIANAAAPYMLEQLYR
jgi:lysophospholipase L1-like esterase